MRYEVEEVIVFEQIDLQEDGHDRTFTLGRANTGFGSVNGQYLPDDTK
jgi:hypothetical protein